MSFKY
jgi:hypothetical protein